MNCMTCGFHRTRIFWTGWMKVLRAEIPLAGTLGPSVQCPKPAISRYKGSVKNVKGALTISRCPLHLYLENYNS